MMEDLALKLAVLGGALMPAAILGASFHNVATDVVLAAAAVTAAAVLWRQLIVPLKHGLAELERIRHHVDTEAPEVERRLDRLEQKEK